MSFIGVSARQVEGMTLCWPKGLCVIHRKILQHLEPLVITSAMYVISSLRGISDVDQSPLYGFFFVNQTITLDFLDFVDLDWYIICLFLPLNKKDQARTRGTAWIVRQSLMMKSLPSACVMWADDYDEYFIYLFYSFFSRNLSLSFERLAFFHVHAPPHKRATRMLAWISNPLLPRCMERSYHVTRWHGPWAPPA